jgi:hypothetical protein
METFGNQNMLTVKHTFYCNFCYFGTSKKSTYVNHLNTKKHNGNVLETNGNQNMPKLCSPNYSCELCNKVFKNRSGLWKHNKICQTNHISQPVDKDELILMLVKQNSELIKETSDFKTLMMEIIKNGTHNSHTNNSHNKSFNLQFFLNETCKDAMNIMEFVDSIQLQLADLEKVGELGYVEGISNIIVKNLNNLDVTQRPIHCTDKKREVLYVKHENKWEKEDEQNSKVRRIIKRVAFKNSFLLRTFREKYPEYKDPQSKVSDRYNKFIIEAMGGKGNDEGEKENRIIKNITKVVSIEKENEPVA